MFLTDKTITTIFIVPTLGIDKELLKKHGFINGYLKDLNHLIEYEDVAYLLFKPKNLTQFSVFLDELYNNNKLIIEDYNFNEKTEEIVVIFKLDERFKKDYDLILNSKYSKVSKEFKELFPKVIVINNVPTKSLHTLIFEKDKRLLAFWENYLGSNIISSDDLELWPSIDLKKEILNYENDN